jgi:hypothetical protein
MLLLSKIKMDAALRGRGRALVVEIFSCTRGTSGGGLRAVLSGLRSAPVIRYMPADLAQMTAATTRGQRA